MDVNFIFSIIILILSVVLHELSHGYAAEIQGDPTARLAGRLTLNPLKHLDPVGSFLVPLLSYQFHFMIGWAKPVPYNPYNLTKTLWGLPAQAGEAIVAAAGPATNIFIALVFGLFLRFYGITNIPIQVATLVSSIVLINLVLAIFNLMPVPPLDGSKILFSLFPSSLASLRVYLEKYSLILIFVFIFFIWKLIVPVVFLLFSLITGLSL